MQSFRLYHINEHYVSYLHSIDSKVQFNKGQRRPYVGIVLSINGVDYYVPLESPKPNHENIKSGGPVLKLDGGTLGIMGFNNMIPVIPSCLIDFDIQTISDQKYKMLLINQLNFCEKNKDVILRRAETTYQKATEKKIPLYKKICCDFQKLERKCRKYDPEYFAKKTSVKVSIKK
uniref:Toxin ToxN, type III toxin-antitoxin system n=1 Tax=Myoviridae sp. ctuev19 TaxID=2827716 RepID=A0A8S5SF11_9CAUD|nr:MAG TPA: Toxin ToxN, type III toxin-antitoxin system [Myoviridae sp. ctuev19]DAQ81012.1 MAG TPA: Toxin ToxN, type III toxin-antitoxin system [Caudoviricetes sp.]